MTTIVSVPLGPGKNVIIQEHRAGIESATPRRWKRVLVCDVFKVVIRLALAMVIGKRGRIDFGL
jgi:hypothetical protein